MINQNEVFTEMLKMRGINPIKDFLKLEDLRKIIKYIIS